MIRVKYRKKNSELELDVLIGKHGMSVLFYRYLVEHELMNSWNKGVLASVPTHGFSLNFA